MVSSTLETRPAQTPGVEEETGTDTGPVALTGPDDLLAEGVINPHTIDGVVDLVSDERERPSSMRPVAVESPLPWYRTPSPWWMLLFIFTGAISMGSTIAPRLEIFNRLVCQELRPEYITFESPLSLDAGAGWWHTQLNFPPGQHKKCMTDPFVQAAVTRLLAGTSVTTGIISCFLGGWWGQFSDRNGRRLLFAIIKLGPLSMDLTILLLCYTGNPLPGGYRLLFVPAVIDGLVGGLSAASAVSHAYISDCVPPAALSRYLAFALGLLYTGQTLGPAMGAFLISATDNLLAAYYAAFAFHLMSLLSAFIIPESLPLATRINNIEKQLSEHAEEQQKRCEEIEQERPENGMSSMQRRSRQLSRIFKDGLFFLRPLALFIPSSNGKGGKGWNLTRIAICFSCYGIIISSFTFKIQYANLVFGWSSKELAYYVSLRSFVRAIFLVAVLPALLKLFAPKLVPAVALPIVPNDTTQSSPSALPMEPAAITESQLQTARHRAASFDLTVARISLLIEIVAFVVTAAVSDPMWWAAATISSAFGGGFAAALKSLAVKLHKGDRPTNEVGRLFGALGVLQGLCSQIIGPSIFGLTLISTINTFPQAIFIIAAAVQVASFTSLSLIRLPLPTPPDAEQSPPLDNDETPE